MFDGVPNLLHSWETLKNKTAPALNDNSVKNIPKKKGEIKKKEEGSHSNNLYVFLQVVFILFPFFFTLFLLLKLKLLNDSKVFFGHSEPRERTSTTQLSDCSKRRLNYRGF